VILVIDTTEISKDPLMAKPGWLTLATWVRHDENRVVIPRAVVRELILQFLDEHSAPLERAVTAIEPLVGISLLSTQIPDLREKFEARILARIAELGFEVEPIPAFPHDAVFDRIERKQRPFRDGKIREEGYRDFLIWQTALHVAELDDVTLVTQNSRDFADGDSLHPDLVRDVSPPDRISLCLGIASFISETAAPWLQSPEGSLAQLQTDTAREAISTWLEANLANGRHEIAAESIGVDPELEDLALVAVDDASCDAIEDVRLLDNGKWLVRARITACLGFDVFVYKASSEWLIEEYDIDIHDWNWNSHYAWGSMQHQAEVEVQMLVDAASLTPESAEILEISLGLRTV